MEAGLQNIQECPYRITAPMWDHHRATGGASCVHEHREVVWDSPTLHIHANFLLGFNGSLAREKERGVGFFHPGSSSHLVVLVIMA